MNWTYDLGRVLLKPHSAHANFQVREAQYQLRDHEFPDNSAREKKRRFIAKVYPRTNLEDADGLLKEALRLIGRKSSCILVDVEVINPDPKKPPFEVRLIFEQLENQLDESVLRSDDSQPVHQKGLSKYTVGESIYNTATVQVKKATSSTSEPLIVKQYLRGALFEVNTCIREGIYQARVAHPNCCHLQDIALLKVGKNFQLSLVMERLRMSVKDDMLLERVAPYSDEELCRCVVEIGTALLHAKNLVHLTQGIAHRDIKPGNILLTDSGHFKLADFGCSWELKDRSVTKDNMGTMWYMAPEVKGTNPNRPFPADVYSFGVTLLHMGVLNFQQADLDRMQAGNEKMLREVFAQKIQQLTCSELMKAAIRGMVAFDPAQRPTLERLVEQFSTAPTPSPLVLHIQRLRLRVFDTRSCAWGAPVALLSTINVDEGTVYTLLTADSLLCCGGGGLRRDEDNKRPGTRRARPGVVYCEGATYVFGGWSKDYADVGCMQQGRFDFSPCLHQRKIYLCGGYTNTVELFSLATHSFQSGPPVVLPEEKPTVCWIADEMLIIVSSSYTTRVRFLQGDAVSEEHQKKMFSVNSSPVVKGDSVWWISDYLETICARTKVTGGKVEEYHLVE